MSFCYTILFHKILVLLLTRNMFKWHLAVIHAHFIFWNKWNWFVVSVEGKQLCITHNDTSQTDEQRLLAKLMQGYSKQTRPVHNASHTVNVHVGITLTQIFDVVRFTCTQRVTYCQRTCWNNTHSDLRRGKIYLYTMRHILSTYMLE